MQPGKRFKWISTQAGMHFRSLYDGAARCCKPTETRRIVKLGNRSGSGIAGANLMECMQVLFQFSAIHFAPVQYVELKERGSTAERPQEESRAKPEGARPQFAQAGRLFAGYDTLSAAEHV